MWFIAIIAAFLTLRYLCGISQSPINNKVYSFSFNTIDGKPFSLADFKGKVILVVNTASRCGFTKQYGAMQSLYEKYRERGLVVIAVPSNDFHDQEPGSAEEIKSFCESRFHITFLITDKVHVKGEQAHPFFAQVRQERGFAGSPHWNFYKYIISREGYIAHQFSSMTAPDSGALVKALEAELAKPSPDLS